MRASTCVLLACIGLAACGAAPTRFATAEPVADAADQAAVPPAPQHPPTSASELNIADFMYGPPPHTRIDPRMRCRFDCPTYPANLPPPVQ